jgi:hypothetical protein
VLVLRIYGSVVPSRRDKKRNLHTLE